MKLYMKIGTGPGLIWHLCNKHKEPKIGDLVFIKDNYIHGSKKERVLIDDIVETSHGRLFLAQKF